ncbi:MAG TPA: 30S ribosomal protein S12 methylthiotransferase RimO, partial [Xanthomonadales bacterium]|nr:30S ribosomal protein S12 methylthiotransferase RimO [Xanthomonadales bacterium]
DLGLAIVPDEVKEDRWHRFMQHQQDISARRLARRIGHTMQVLIDEVEGNTAVGRTAADAPEIDGVVHVKLGRKRTLPGAILPVYIEDADAYDLYGTAAA